MSRMFWLLSVKHGGCQLAEGTGDLRDPYISSYFNNLKGATSSYPSVSGRLHSLVHVRKKGKFLPILW
jgi:hypothetical protein